MLYKGDTLYLDWLEDGIAELVFDAPGSVNKLDTATVASLGEAIGVLEQQSDLKGLLLRSNKAAFIVGADITEFLSLFLVPEEQLSQWLHFANSVFNRLEDLPVPTIAAVNGYALGGGCECVLATDYRLATPDLRIGLPETKLGIMPGFGGSVRMPRMLGADSALEIIAAGKDVGADQALKIGLVDGVVKAEKLVEGAKAVLRQAINGDLDWKAKRQPKLEPLKLSKIEATMSFTIAKGMVAQTAGKHYPAPITAVKTIEAAARFGREEALNLENKSFVPLAHTNEARALVGIFLNDQYVKGKAKKLTKDVETPKQAAVLGAGIMGGGIAYQSAWKGVPVVMKDINDKSLTTIGVLPILLAQATTFAMVSSELFSPRIISTNGIRWTGLKKCIPQKFSGRSSALASSLIGMVEVLDASTVSGRTFCSVSASTAFFTFGFSTTASTTTSTRSNPA